MFKQLFLLAAKICSHNIDGLLVQVDNFSFHVGLICSLSAASCNF